MGGVRSFCCNEAKKCSTFCLVASNEALMDETVGRREGEESADDGYEGVWSLDGGVWLSRNPDVGTSGDV
jgi:hypothetical protein